MESNYLSQSSRPENLLWSTDAKVRTQRTKPLAASLTMSALLRVEKRCAYSPIVFPIVLSEYTMFCPRVKLISIMHLCLNKKATNEATCLKEVIQLMIFQNHI